MPDISGLINQVACNKSNANCMMQRFETCKTLCFWHEFTKAILDENDLKQLQYAQWQKQIKMTTSNELNYLVRWLTLLI